MMQTLLGVTQFEKKRALSAPKNTVHRERDGEASTKPPSLVAVGLVEAVHGEPPALGAGGCAFSPEPS